MRGGAADSVAAPHAPAEKCCHAAPRRAPRGRGGGTQAADTDCAGGSLIWRRARDTPRTASPVRRTKMLQRGPSCGLWRSIGIILLTLSNL